MEKTTAIILIGLLLLVPLAVAESDASPQKHVSEFEKFKLFYENADGKPIIVRGVLDANTENIAETTFGENKAYVKIKSSTPNRITVGLDFNDGSSKLYTTWKIKKTEIHSLESYLYTDEGGIFTSEKEPELSTEKTENGLIFFTKEGEDLLEHKITLDTVNGKNAVKLNFATKIYITAENIMQPVNLEINTIWIGTKLSDPKADLSCVYDNEDASLDDFARRSTVEGKYSSKDAFFDTFTDYCKDETTLVNYGCIGITGDSWKQSSRVAFLEVTCPDCTEGRCTEGPYCMDTDKHASDPIYTKGKLTIYTPKEALITRNPNLKPTGKAIAELQSAPQELGTTLPTITPNLDNLGAPGETILPEIPDRATNFGMPDATLSPYNNGMQKLKGEDLTVEEFEDLCEGNQLKEYSCDSNTRNGYTFELTDCPGGCEKGKCLVLETPADQSWFDKLFGDECTTDRECALGEMCSRNNECVERPEAEEEFTEKELESLRFELKKLESMIAEFKGIYEEKGIITQATNKIINTGKSVNKFLSNLFK